MATFPFKASPLLSTCIARYCVAANPGELHLYCIDLNKPMLMVYIRNENAGCFLLSSRLLRHCRTPFSFLLAWRKRAQSTRLRVYFPRRNTNLSCILWRRMRLDLPHIEEEFFFNHVIQNFFSPLSSPSFPGLGCCLALVSTCVH